MFLHAKLHKYKTVTIGATSVNLQFANCHCFHYISYYQLTSVKDMLNTKGFIALYLNINKWADSVEAQGSWVCTFKYTWFDFRTWKTVIRSSRKIWFACLKYGQFVWIPSWICWISKIFRACQVTTHFKGNFMLTKNFIRNLCSKSKAKKL